MADRHVIKSLLPESALTRWENIGIHALPKGIFALDLIDPPRGVLLEIVAEILFWDLAVRLVHDEMPVGIGTVVPRCYALAEERELDVDARLLETFAD
jgi:hypothetical protein